MKKFYFIIAAIIVIILGLGAILIVNWVKPIPELMRSLALSSKMKEE